MKERRYSYPGKDEKNKRQFSRGRKLAALVFAVGTIALCLAGCGAEKDGDGGDGLPTLTEIKAAAGRTWSYTDAASSGGETENGEWLADDFAAADWSAATGSFGAKEGELKALADGFSPSVYLQHYNEDGEALPAYYFRLEFSAEAEDKETPLITEIAYDDAVIIYLNGEEIFSANVPEGGYESPVSYGCEETCGDPQTEDFVLDTSLLREGKNVLAVELHQSDKESSDVYFEMGDFLPASAAALPERRSLQSDTLCLGVGSDGSQMLVTWRGPICNGAFVQLEAASGSPAADNTEEYPAEAVYVDKSEGTCTYRCVLSDLAPGEYFYRTVDDETSEAFSFVVPEESDGFSFLCHGDAQIIDDKNFYGLAVYENLAAKTADGQSPALVLSLGDQADDGGDLDLYRLFTSTPLLKSVPLAAVVGNHERKYEEFSRAFYMPNVDKETVDKSGDMSGDYWFFRGNTLFLCLNSNNGDVEAHEKFMAEAEAACEAKYGKQTWTVAALHFSFFSAGRHAEDDNIADKRDAYAAAFEKAGVDAVFSGHDHSYTRSYPLQGSKPAGEGRRGVVYFTLGSPTGSKLYDLNDKEFDYVAFSADGEYPMMTRVDVTDSAMTVTTYQYRSGGIETLDAYVIEK